MTTKPSQPPPETAKAGNPDEPPAVWVPIEKLRPWAKNPRHIEDLSDIMYLLERYGWSKPLVARRANDEVIAGHRTLRAALKLGLKLALVRYLDVGEGDAHLLALGDNATSDNGRWDEAALPDVLAELERANETAALEALGFDLAKPEPVEVKELDVSDVHDEFWLSVRGPLPAQPEALDRLRAALEELEGVTVDLGTTQL